MTPAQPNQRSALPERRRASTDGNGGIGNAEPDEFTLPSDVSMERCLLGSCIFNGMFFPEMASMVGDDFICESHRAIFEALACMADQGQPIDLLILARELESRGKLKTIGGQAYLEDLTDGAVKRTVVTPYVSRLRKLSARRYVMRVGEVAQHRAAQAGCDVADLMRYQTPSQAFV